MHQPNYITASMIDKQILTENLAILKLKPETKFKFEPGQYATLEMEGTLRPYSICSSPQEDTIELFLEMVPDSLRKPISLTPKLFHLHKGDPVHLLSKAKGKFTLDETAHTHVMVCTVTGIAPFMSMIRAYLNGYYENINLKEPIYLFQGASYLDEFGYLEELKSYEKIGKLVYVPTVSRPQEEHNRAWQGQTGRVNDILEDFFKRYKITPKDTLIYLCGHRGMIEALGNKRETPQKPLGKLIQKGYSIQTEAYF